VDDPGQGHILDPGADAGEKGARPEQTEVADLEGGEKGGKAGDADTFGRGRSFWFFEGQGITFSGYFLAAFLADAAMAATLRAFKVSSRRFRRRLISL
jgi:hypothetical protein